MHQPDWSSDDAAYRWVDMASLGLEVCRNQLIGAISNDLIQMLSNFEDVGFSPLVERWNALSSYRGERVRVGSAHDFIEGDMHSVDSAGALLVVDDSGVEHRFADSNVSVRLVSES